MRVYGTIRQRAMIVYGTMSGTAIKVYGTKEDGHESVWHGGEPCESRNYHGP